jgi:hypothetical protein
MDGTRFTGRLVRGALLMTVSFTCACGRSGGQTRRPPADYPPPPRESQGEILGADRQTPSDKLMTGPRVGTGGVTPAGSATSEPKK